MLLSSRALRWQFEHTSAKICEAGLPASRFWPEAGASGAAAKIPSTHGENRQTRDPTISRSSAHLGCASEANAHTLIQFLGWTERSVGPGNSPRHFGLHFLHPQPTLPRARSKCRYRGKLLEYSGHTSVSLEKTSAQKGRLKCLPQRNS